MSELETAMGLASEKGEEIFVICWYYPLDKTFGRNSLKRWMKSAIPERLRLGREKYPEAIHWLISEELDADDDLNWQDPRNKYFIHPSVGARLEDSLDIRGCITWISVMKEQQSENFCTLELDPKSKEQKKVWSFDCFECGFTFVTPYRGEDGNVQRCDNCYKKAIAKDKTKPKYEFWCPKCGYKAASEYPFEYRCANCDPKHELPVTLIKTGFEPRMAANELTAAFKQLNTVWQNSLDGQIETNLCLERKIADLENELKSCGENLKTIKDDFESRIASLEFQTETRRNR